MIVLRAASRAAARRSATEGNRYLMSDRKVPSLNALRTFEVAARCLSFTEAAEELCVTQGAVSQRIKALELDLEAPLFHRRSTGLALTALGERLSLGVREAMERIATALDDEAVCRPVRVSVLPSFAACWLMPRLLRFAERYPSIQVNVLPQGEIIDLKSLNIDLAIRFGRGRYPGLTAQYLMGDATVPVCGPALVARHGLPRTAESLTRTPIISDSSTENDDSRSSWASWLGAMGRSDIRLVPSLSFGQADFALDAAARGLGVALARTSLIGEHLAEGRLIRLPIQAVPTAYDYHLVWRPEAAAMTAELRSWLVAEAANTSRSQGCVQAA